MNTKLLFITSLVTYMGLLGCKEQTEPPSPYYYSYYPLKVGQCLHYKVDSIVYNEFSSQIDTFSFYLKDTCTEAQDGTYQFVQYRLHLPDSNWIFRESKLKRLEKLYATELHDNVTETKMAFPVREGKSWKAFSYNSIAQQEYHYAAIHLSLNLGLLNFDSTLTVVQQNESNLISEKYSIENYASGIGLIYKEVKSLEKDIQTQAITAGSIYRQTMIKGL